jgi:hypothetical protein
MHEQEFENFLSHAYRVPPESPPPPDLTLAIMARMERRRVSRTAVLGLAGAVGVGVVAAALAATGLVDRLVGLASNIPPEPAMIDPSLVVGLGFLLMLAAAARNWLREF